MAVYKIFPEKDAFISSYRSTQNFGRDEILEISNETEITDVTRALIQFPTSQITDVVNNKGIFYVNPISYHSIFRKECFNILF